MLLLLLFFSVQIHETAYQRAAHELAAAKKELVELKVTTSLGGGDPHMKMSGILVISLRGVSHVNTGQQLFQHQKMKLAIHFFISNFSLNEEQSHFL